VTETPKSKPPQKDGTTLNETGNGVCGIVMPISQMSEEYSVAHWMRVRKILETAVRKANFTPKVVWDNPELDVIQSKILQNIYDNEIIICDLSNLNPNVMLESGLRLSTKKPTILVTDGFKKPPFDISSVEYISYQRDLEYNSIEVFINKLSERISSVSKSHRAGSYKSFIDSYQFEIAKPETIEVSSDKYIIDQINDLRLIFEKYIYSNEKNNIGYRKNKGNSPLNEIRFQYNGKLSNLMSIISNFHPDDLYLSEVLSAEENNISGYIFINEKDTKKCSRIKEILIDMGVKLS